MTKTNFNCWQFKTHGLTIRCYVLSKVTASFVMEFTNFRLKLVEPEDRFSPNVTQAEYVLLK